MTNSKIPAPAPNVLGPLWAADSSQPGLATFAIRGRVCLGVLWPEFMAAARLPALV